MNRGNMELTQVLEATLSPDNQTIRLAEEQLQKAAQTNLVWHTHTPSCTHSYVQWNPSIPDTLGTTCSD